MEIFAIIGRLVGCLIGHLVPLSPVWPRLTGCLLHLVNGRIETNLNHVCPQNKNAYAYKCNNNKNGMKDESVCKLSKSRFDSIRFYFIL